MPPIRTPRRPLGSPCSHSRRSPRRLSRALSQRPRYRGIERFLGHPTLPLCLVFGVLALVAVAIASHGFSVTRHLAAGVSYRDPRNVVILAQGPPVFGIRLGFRDLEANLFRDKAKTLSAVAAYSWHSATITLRRGPRLVKLANVDPSFFDVLGVHSPVEHLQENEFLASYDFWRDTLHGDPNRVGQMMTIDGHPLRLAGVLPRNFTFLSEPISIWTSHREPILPVNPRRGWLNLRGVVARLNPGVTPDAARKELRQIQATYGVANRNFEMQATPIEELIYRAFRSYAGNLATLLGALLAWAAVRFVMDRRAGAPAKRAARFWGFFALKTMLPLIALFFAIVELTGASATGPYRRRSRPRRAAPAVGFLRIRGRDSGLGVSRSAGALPRVPASFAPSRAHRHSRPDAAGSRGPGSDVPARTRLGVYFGVRFGRGYFGSLDEPGSGA